MSFIRQAIHCRIINTVTTDFWLAMTLLRIQICRVIKWWTLPHLCHGTGSTKHEEKNPLLCRLSNESHNEIHYLSFLYARLKNGRIMLWQCPSVCPSVRPSVRPSFPDFFSTCFEISNWNLVYAFSRWHDMSSLSFITIGSLWPSLQPNVGQTQFLQSWPYKSR